MSVEKTSAAREAYRYIENAREMLSEKANKQDGFYQDPKYVKLAGHAAYAGILLALDSVFGKKKGRKDVDWYLKHLAGTDRKLFNQFQAAYETLHLGMSHDGNPDAEVAQIGLKRAESIVDWVETRGEQV